MKKKSFLFIIISFYSVLLNSQYTKLYDLKKENDIVSPYSDIVFNNNILYGMSYKGGSNKMGCIYKINSDGKDYLKLLDFNGLYNGSNPQGSLILIDGKLYGMTCGGGVNNMGCIFKINIDGTGYAKLFDFNGSDNGSNPYGNLIIQGNILFGMTSAGGKNDLGCIFKINTDGTDYEKLLDFDSANGSYPNGSLSILDTMLYGMTRYGGAFNKGCIFKISTNGNEYSSLLNFNDTIGILPFGDLTLFDTSFYGMTAYGGINNRGTVFKINTDGTGYKKQLDFDSIKGRNPFGRLYFIGDTMYGTTSSGGTNNLGCIFKINTTDGNYTNLLNFDSTNGSSPRGLALSDNILFGITSTGGANNVGAIYRVETNGSNYTKLLDCNYGIDGDYPGTITSDGNKLYGTTFMGGIYDKGCVYTINFDGTGYSKLLDFNGIDNGSKPYGGLSISQNILYGITFDGGAYYKGCIFKMNKDGTGFSRLFDFNGAEYGSNPYGALTILDGVMYGTTSKGGTNNFGCIFKINIDGSGYIKLLDFNGNENGKKPYGSLILSGNVLYGMTRNGGFNNAGCIFKINTDGTDYKKLHSFSSSYPEGALTLLNDELYGMTPIGGSSFKGSIFKIHSDGTLYKNIFEFDGKDNGYFPIGSLTLIGNEFYGANQMGGNNDKGCLFKFNIDGTGFTKLMEFNGINGSNPQSDLYRVGNFLYGTTNSGGIYNAGVIYKYELSGVTTPLTRNPLIISVYPNPFTETFKIEFYQEKQNDVIVEIYDVVGKKEFETIYKNQASGDVILELNAATCNLNIGLHTIKIISGDKVFLKKCFYCY